ncbi:MAG: 4-(cytidine 5'-diphospho)-2-C-methyl-D-erythritol kinase, partial [Acidobacteriota bacterium]
HITAPIVLQRLPDGDHAVRTLLQTIDLGDDLFLEDAPVGELHLAVGGPAAVAPGEGNLVLKAARLLLAQARTMGLTVNRGARLRLHKVVPAGAGLGGGSGDAAATLLLLNRFYGLGLSRRTLQDLARRLGADVPFFLEGGLARGHGRGDHLRRLPELPAFDVIIMVPPFRLATRKVYRWFDGVSLTSSGAGSRMPAVLGRLRRRKTAHLVNDLQDPVFFHYAQLAKARDELRKEGAMLAGLSGSGSSVFGLYETSPAGMGCWAPWEQKGWTLHRTRFLSGEEYRARFQWA